MEVSARAASSADLPALAALATEAIAGLQDQKGGRVFLRHRARPTPPDDSLRADLDAADVHVVVGTIDDVPVGYAVIRVEELADGGRLGNITDLFTLEGARAVSVGESMMDQLVAWATDSGCFGIDSVALPGDRHTKNFFESFGLVARAITVHKPLR